MSDKGAAGAADAGAGADKGAVAGADAGKAAGADAGKAGGADAGAKAGADVGKGAADAGKDAGAAKGAGSILDGTQADLLRDAAKDQDGADAGKRAAAAQTWPDDWREQMAGGDAELAKMLKRYASPNSVTSAFKNLRTRLDSGEFKKPLAADATDDEKAAYRKDNGIPDKPGDYGLPDGLQVAEVDKPIIDAFKNFAHERNWTPQMVKEVVAWRYAAREQENEQMYERDQQFRQSNEDALRAEFGPEYRGNINGLGQFMSQTFGKDLTAAIFSARLGDGSLAGNNSDFIKGMINLMKEVNPAATVTLPSGDRSGKGVEARITELEGMMNKDITAWQSNTNKAAQDEYMELIRTREKLAARAA